MGGRIDDRVLPASPRVLHHPARAAATVLSSAITARHSQPNASHPSVVDGPRFVNALIREHDRIARGAKNGACLVLLDVQNQATILERQPAHWSGPLGVHDLSATLESQVCAAADPGDIVAALPSGAIAWLIVGSTNEALRRANALLIGTFSGTWEVGGRHVRAVGAAGVLDLGPVCRPRRSRRSVVLAEPSVPGPHRRTEDIRVHPTPGHSPISGRPLIPTFATQVGERWQRDSAEVLLAAAQLALDVSRLRRDNQAVVFDAAEMAGELSVRLSETSLERRVLSDGLLAAGGSLATVIPAPALPPGVADGNLASGRATTRRAAWWSDLRLSGVRRTVWLAVVAMMLVFGAPWAIYTAAVLLGHDISSYAFWLVLSGLLTTTGYLYIEGLLAIEPTEVPPRPEGPMPSATAVVAAYLPNEAHVIVDTINHLLRMPYEGGLEVLLAYNTPHPVQVERELVELAAREPRFRVMRVSDSSSKAQNVNAALDRIESEIVGVFDADHWPMPGSFERAACWLGSGWDVVQGHCAVRNADASRVAAIVAAEFEVIYSVNHPGRSRLAGYGLFGGSNGYWRTDVLHAVRMDPVMLTEDIDCSVRAVLAGAHVAYDRGLVSTELAPTTWKSLARQRGRWSQGWAQVSKKWLRSLLASPFLERKQKVGTAFLFGWRELQPWLAWQMVALLAWQALHGMSYSRPLPAWLLTAALTLGVSAFQAVLGYSLGWKGVAADRRRLFIRYALANTLFYSEFRSMLARVAHMREFLGERTWRVTHRAFPEPETPRG